MVSGATTYTRELRERFGYSATWVPNADVRLGDVGLLRGHSYERVSSLADFGLTFTVRESRARGVYDFASSGSVAFGFKAAGEAAGPLSKLTDAEAGIAIDFSSADASVFQAAGCTVSEISDQHTLGQQLLALKKEGRWPDDYAVVCEVISADRATILVSSSGNARIEFSAKSGVKLGPQSLVDADAGLNVTNSSGLGIQILAEGALTPLFRAKGIRQRFLSEPEFKTRGRGASTPAAEDGDDAFVDVDYQDFE